MVISSLEKYNQITRAAQNAEHLAMIDRGQENRLIYNIDGHGNLWIIACKGHYDD